MKCIIMLHFIRIYTVCVGKIEDKIIQYFFLNYKLTPVDMYNGLSQVYCIKLEGKSISNKRFINELDPTTVIETQRFL